MLDNQKKDLAQFRNTETIYDAITMLYLFVIESGKENNYIVKHARFCNNTASEVKTLRRELARAVQLMAEGVGKTDYIDGMELLLKLYRENEEYLCELIIETLYCFDNELSDLPVPHQQFALLNRGPVNEIRSQDSTHAFCFLMTEDIFQGDFLKLNKLHVKRLDTAHPSGLRNKFHNFTVLRMDELREKKTFVRAYYPDKTARERFESGNIRIAFFPYSNQEWFSVPTASDGLTMNVEYTSEQDDLVLMAFAKAFEAAEKAEADLLVLPELALGKNARGKIQKYLQKNALDNFHVKLVFAGSSWHSGENTAFVFTGGGRELLFQRKREAFERYDKVRGLELRENLRDHENSLFFLDVPGLGRISYVVCRDFLDAEERFIRTAYLRSRFFIVSAYSPRTMQFVNAAREMATNSAVITAVCNCCAALDKKEKNPLDQYVVFTMTPSSDGESLTDVVMAGNTECDCPAKQNCVVCAYSSTADISFSNKVPRSFCVECKRT